MTHSIELLGQSGCIIQGRGFSICVDPYLSNSVQELDAPDLKRLMPIPYQPEDLSDLDWIIITHEHIDHCDPHTLPALAKASQNARFLGPAPVCEILKKWGIPDSQIQLCKEDWLALDSAVSVCAVPAAHPTIERDAEGNLRAVGYVIRFDGHTIYIAGDTGLTEDVIAPLKELGSIHTALLPVNEQNFYRDRRNIIGNMSVRDAFSLAAELEIGTVIPVHWDMFAVNSVTPEEIKAVYDSMSPRFELMLGHNLVYEFNTELLGKAV